MTCRLSVGRLVPHRAGHLGHLRGEWVAVGFDDYLPAEGSRERHRLANHPKLDPENGAAGDQG